MGIDGADFVIDQSGFDSFFANQFVAVSSPTDASIAFSWSKLILLSAMRYT